MFRSGKFIGIFATTILCVGTFLFTFAFAYRTMGEETVAKQSVVAKTKTIDKPIVFSSVKMNEVQKEIKKQNDKNTESIRSQNEIDDLIAELYDNYHVDEDHVFFSEEEFKKWYDSFGKKDSDDSDDEPMIVAISNIFGRANPNVSEEKRTEYAEYVYDASNKFGVNPKIAAALLIVESTVKERAVSKAGAVGLMQINWKAHRKSIGKAFGHIKTKEDLMRPKNNIDVGIWLFSNFVRMNNNNVEKGLHRYLGTKSSSYVKKVMTWREHIRNNHNNMLRDV